MNAYEHIKSLSPRARQHNRPMKLDTSVGEDVLLPLRATGYSRIGRDYGFTVDMVSTSAQIELKQLIAQPVTLWIRQNDKSYQPHHGYVHTVRRLGADGGLVHTQLEFASWLHFLRFRKDARIWQDKTVTEILADVFNAHPQARGKFRFNLYGRLSNPLPQRSFCMQYEDDWNFVHRLMESEGLWSYFEQAQDGKSHTLVITDYNYFCDELPLGQIKFSRTAPGTEVDEFSLWSGTRTLQSVRYTGVTGDYKVPRENRTLSRKTLRNQGDLPDQTEVYEYTGKYTWLDDKRGDHLAMLQMEERESRAKRFHGAGDIRCMDAGRYFELRNHPDHESNAQQERQFLAIEVRWFIASNLPAGNTRPFPKSLETELASVRADYLGEEPAGEKPGASTMGKSDGFFLTRVEAQRMSVPYRSPFEHRKPRMRIQTATVTGPASAEVYTDPLNRIKARFEWDRLNDGDENASCWLRVAMSDTGGGYGGVHVPRVGEEVLVDWIDGDCDRPIVTGRVYNGSKAPSWHSNGILSGYRSKEYGGSGYNQIVLDDATNQNRLQIYSSSANSQLHLGYLIAQNGNTRGTYLGIGFELKSDAYGAILAGRGLYVSTHATTATQQLSVQPASEQLINAENVLEAVSGASVAGQAESMRDGQEDLRRFTEASQHSVAGSGSNGGLTAGGGLGSANGFSKPILLMASPEGIAMSTPQSTHIGADRYVNIVSGRDANVAAGRSLIVSVVEKISLFVQKAGIKLFAARGKVDIQAQSDEMSLTAQKNLTLRSTDAQLALAAEQEVMMSSINNQVTISAKQGITLMSGGAYIRIVDGNIELHCPGNIRLKSASFRSEGPARISDSETLWPGHIPANFSAKVFVDKQIQERIGATGTTPYQFIDGRGAVVAKGVMDQMGATQRMFHTNTERLHLMLGDKGDWLKTEHLDESVCDCSIDHPPQAHADFNGLVGSPDSGNAGENGQPLQTALAPDAPLSFDAETEKFQQQLLHQLVFDDPAIKQAIADGEE
ncbi:type VI secretion system Vgr family protein [Paraburkholderia sp. A1RI-2L]|uniref:type VI secretion system Vgr family protein n=1 Tax=Paraburkholderia sp. A1RI-2L TaxID=3028367 RepID=UPI003B81D531